MISEIIIKERIREDIGDITRLKESMKRNGLFHSITISDKNELLAGYRRLEAAKLLGWEEIEVNIIKVKSKLDKFLIELDENLTRKDFTEEEIQKMERVKRYLSAKGFKKFILWIKALFQKIKFMMSEVKAKKNVR